MKAAVCREFGAPLTIEQVRLDPPQAGEVTVRIAACAICHSDITHWQGGWGGALPAVYGHEAAGVVETVGPAVAGLAPGDHVVVTLIRSCGTCHYCLQGQPVLCAGSFRLDAEGPLHALDGAPIRQAMRTGAFAERVTVHASQVVAIPKDVPFASASLLACGVITGLGAVFNTAQVPAGSDVVVVGTGGVGLNSVQGASLCGARSVIAIDLSDGKLAAARRFGATHTLNPASDDLPAAVRQLTHGRGADFVFVTVGAKVGRRAVLRPARPRGHDRHRRHAALGGHGGVRAGRPRRRRPARAGLQDGLGPDRDRRADAGRPLPPGPPQARRAGLRPLPAGGGQRRHRGRDQGRGAAQRDRVLPR